MDRTSQKLKLEIHKQGEGGGHMFQNPMISLPGIYLKLAHFPFKIGLIGGVGGVPEIRFSLESSYFCYLQKFRTLAAFFLVEKQRPLRERGKIMPSTMVTTSSAQRRSDQFFA